MELGDDLKIYHPRGSMATVITSPFGWRKIGGKPQFHAALDFRGAVGTPVYASLEGVVVRVNALNGAGRPDGYQSKQKADGIGADIVLKHKNGLWTRYSHLSECNVKIGEVVCAGSRIGKVGDAGTGPHLHFELLVNYDKRAGGYFTSQVKVQGNPAGEAINPVKYLTDDLTLFQDETPE